MLISVNISIITYYHSYYYILVWTLYVIDKLRKYTNLQMSSTLIKVTEHAQIAGAPPFLVCATMAAKTRLGKMRTVIILITM